MKQYSSDLFPNKNMFPSRSMDYMGDVQNLFSKTRTMYGDTFNYTQSPIVNRSSSSADSTSPESYRDNSVYIRHNTDPFFMRTRSETPKHVYETPKLSYESQVNQYGSFTNINEPFDTSFQNIDTSVSSHDPFSTYDTMKHIFDTPQPRRQHPIGRKILGRNLQTKLDNKITEELENSWQVDTFQQTSPERNYELFPSEKGFQFSSPSKPDISPSITHMRNVSPMTNASPTYTPSFTNMPTNWSPNIQQFTTPFQPNLDTTEIGQKMCTFCRKNGETPVVYMTHTVKEKRGNVYIVTCPILRSHVCSFCGTSGDNAHTLTYCPILRRNNNGKPLKSTTITLKNTRVKSNGRRRY